MSETEARREAVEPRPEPPSADGVASTPGSSGSTGPSGAPGSAGGRSAAGSDDPPAANGTPAEATSPATKATKATKGTKATKTGGAARAAKTSGSDDEATGTEAKSASSGTRARRASKTTASDADAGAGSDSSGADSVTTGADAEGTAGAGGAGGKSRGPRAASGGAESATTGSDGAEADDDAGGAGRKTRGSRAASAATESKSAGAGGESGGADGVTAGADAEGTAGGKGRGSRAASGGTGAKSTGSGDALGAAEAKSTSAGGDGDGSAGADAEAGAGGAGGRSRGSRSAGGGAEAKPSTSAGDEGDGADGDSGAPEGDDATADGEAPRKRRRRGSRGGRKRSKPRADGAEGTSGDGDGEGDDGEAVDGRAGTGRNPSELPDLAREGRPATVEAAEKALVRKATPSGAPPKPKIGDTLPAPAVEAEAPKERSGRRRGRGGGGNGDKAKNGTPAAPAAKTDTADGDQPGGKRRRRRRGRGGGSGGGAGSSGGGGNGSGQVRTRGGQPIEAFLPSGSLDIDDETTERRRGRERKGRPVGRYMMCVQVSEKATQIAVLEGRALIEHYVSRPSDDISQIHGNVYLGRVQNVLPGMEAAFVDIGTPKNAVLYRGDVHYDREDLERSGHEGRQPRIEQVLRAGQTILCQVTKNPIGAKGARLTQEVSLPGRFVVLIPNSSTYGISKRLPDDERKRLRQVLDRVKPAQHGIIVRTAAEGVTTEEIENDVRRLLRQWEKIDQLAKRSKAPTMLYREPDMAVRVIREEFNNDYRGIVIDDRELYEQVRDYVGGISPALADRVEFYDPETEALPLFERQHVHEQLHRALDRKVWLPSGGSLIIEHTEALTVIDVNTGKNVGKSSLEETVFKNNLEAAVEVARQLRLRDIGGIIVVDFIDMERRDNRDKVVQVFRDALSRDKTRTQVFEISELGLCEMTRKRIGEGLLESFSTHCPMCEGRGVLFDKELLPD